VIAVIARDRVIGTATPKFSLAANQREYTRIGNIAIIAKIAEIENQHLTGDNTD